MGTEIIRKFITQQVAFAMAVNTKKYKKKINELEYYLAEPHLADLLLADFGLAEA